MNRNCLIQSLLLAIATLVMNCGEKSTNSRGENADSPTDESEASHSSQREMSPEDRGGSLELLANPISATAVTKPCAYRAGPTPHPDQGSGACVGDLFLPIALPSTGAFLSYNSLASDNNLGFGKGWNLSFRHWLSLDSSKLNLTFTEGSGSSATFVASSSAGPWITRDPRVSRARFEKSGDSIVEVLPGGLRVTFTNVPFSNTYLMKRMDDANGNWLTVGGDLSKEVWTSSMGSVITIGRQGLLFASLTDSDGQIYLFGYNGNNLTSITNPDGSVWSLEYAPSSNLLGLLRSPSGEITQYAYYQNKVLRAIVDHFNFTTNFYYTTTQVTMETILGKTIETFNTLGGIVSATASNLTQTWTRDTANRVTAFKDSIGRTTSFTYSGGSLLPASATDVLGTYAYTYDANFNLSQRVESRGSVTIPSLFTYDTAQRLLTSSTNGKTQRIIRDAKGNVTGTSWDGGAPYDTTAYDTRGLPTSVTNLWSQTVSAEYGSNGTLASLTDGLGRTTTLVTAQSGLPKSVTYSDQSNVGFTYDPMGRTVDKVENPAPNAAGATVMKWSASYALSASGSTMIHQAFVGTKKVADQKTQQLPWNDVLSIRQANLSGPSGQSSGAALNLTADPGSYPVTVQDGASCKLQPTQAPTAAPTFTAAPTMTPGATLTPTKTPTRTATRTPTKTLTPLPSNTPTRTATPTQTRTPTPTPTGVVRTYVFVYTNNRASGSIPMDQSANINNNATGNILLGTFSGNVTVNDPPFILSIETANPDSLNFKADYYVKRSDGTPLLHFGPNQYQTNSLSTTCYDPATNANWPCDWATVTVDSSKPPAEATPKPTPTPQYCPSVMGLFQGLCAAGGQYCTTASLILQDGYGQTVNWINLPGSTTAVGTVKTCSYCGHTFSLKVVGKQAMYSDYAIAVDAIFDANAPVRLTSSAPVNKCATPCTDQVTFTCN